MADRGPISRNPCISFFAANEGATARSSFSRVRFRFGPRVRLFFSSFSFFSSILSTRPLSEKR